MMRTRTDSSLLSWLFKPACIALLLIGLFGLVWLRSSVVSVTYEIRSLEEGKSSALKDLKMLHAERAKLMSLAKVDSSVYGESRRDRVSADGGYVFPDRVKVVHVKRNKGAEPYKASLDVRSRH